MPYRRIAAAFSLALLFLAAAPKKKTPPPAPAAPAVLAPDTIPHAQALFLAGLSKDGKQRLTFKAAAYGKHFFLEEPAGVTVYVYDGNGYRKESFLAKTTLEKAMAMGKYRDEMK